jgi:hypothetical protein
MSPKAKAETSFDALREHMALVNELADEAAERIWRAGEERGIDPGELVRGVSWALSGYSSRISFDRFKSRVDEERKGSSAKRGKRGPAKRSGKS